MRMRESQRIAPLNAGLSLLANVFLRILDIIPLKLPLQKTIRGVLRNRLNLHYANRS
ncbi:uncharacterized protein Dyak_GE27515 [Drosophila yakuba]|uniref:Uncharacterized protein n=1 Tax=Drosophila yakuba TaxID=7245 RepID=A0A0R1DU66_DROYA|nr:uncharacterized protein Dyak_GE27515 [Drosophila yakuba]